MESPTSSESVTRRDTTVGVRRDAVAECALRRGVLSSIAPPGQEGRIEQSKKKVRSDLGLRDGAVVQVQTENSLFELEQPPRLAL